MKKQILLLFSAYMMLLINAVAFDNKIIIQAIVVDRVEVEVFDIKTKRDTLYLDSHNPNGVTVTVESLKNNFKQNIYQNGKLQSLPITYELSDGPFVLASTLVNEKQIIRVGIRAH